MEEGTREKYLRKIKDPTCKPGTWGTQLRDQPALLGLTSNYASLGGLSIPLWLKEMVSLLSSIGIVTPHGKEA